MPIQIANPNVVQKIERLARQTGLNKTAAVEEAVDKMLAQPVARAGGNERALSALLRQLDQVPELPQPVDPLDWDDAGLPR